MVKLTESTVYIRTKCSVENVKKLNLWGCDIDDISVCEKMAALEVLSLSVNNVETLEPLQHCKKLRELYLRKNNIQSLQELEYLKELRELQTLWIDDNPCTHSSEYRPKVIRILPQLVKLDDKLITALDHDVVDDSVPECDMHSSFNSLRSSRSSNAVLEPLMTRSLYGRAIVDTVMQPQMPHFGDTSDEEKSSSTTTATPLTLETTTLVLRDAATSSRSASRLNVMSQSVYGALPEEPTADDEWTDFSMEDDFRPTPMEGRMFASMHESIYMTPERRPVYGRSVSVPRRRISRPSSSSPARDVRLSKIMSAVSVLLDELDHDGLRQVVDEAQRRMKKQR